MATFGEPNERLKKEVVNVGDTNGTSRPSESKGWLYYFVQKLKAAAGLDDPPAEPPDSAGPAGPPRPEGSDPPPGPNESR